MSNFPGEEPPSSESNPATEGLHHQISSRQAEPAEKHFARLCSVSKFIDTCLPHLVSTEDDATHARIVEALASVSTGEYAVYARIVEALD